MDVAWEKAARMGEVLRGTDAGAMVVLVTVVLVPQVLEPWCWVTACAGECAGR